MKFHSWAHVGRICCPGRSLQISIIQSSGPHSPPQTLWCRFQHGCVALCQWATCSSSSSHKTINPSHNKCFSHEGRGKMTLKPIDPIHVICPDFCVIIPLLLRDPLTVWNGCLRGWFASFYIWPGLCNAGYSTRKGNEEGGVTARVPVFPPPVSLSRSSAETALHSAV